MWNTPVSSNKYNAMLMSNMSVSRGICREIVYFLKSWFFFLFFCKIIYFFRVIQTISNKTKVVFHLISYGDQLTICISIPKIIHHNWRNVHTCRNLVRPRNLERYYFVLENRILVQMDPQPIQSDKGSNNGLKFIGGILGWISSRVTAPRES